MILLKKKQNIVLSIRDRELLSLPKTHFLNLNIMSQRILSTEAGHNLNVKHWSKTSSRHIAYDGGLLFFDNYSTCYSVYGFEFKPKLYTFQATKARKRISDVVSYITPIFKIIDQCMCGFQKCACLSRFLLSISEDSWLCQHNLNSGHVVRQVYVGPNYRFKYCDWDLYGERIVLTSCLNPFKNKSPGAIANDVVVNLAVFTVLPLEFYAVLQIKRSVFGKTCKHVNVSEELLLLGMGTFEVHIYSFPDVLKEGCVTPFKLGDSYGKGNVGYPPIGLPLNYHVNSAPPLLFDVQCFGQEIRFGGFPFCYIICSVRNQFNFLVRNIDGHKALKNGSLKSNELNDEPNPVSFHPDNSNRIIFRNSQAVHCYKIVNSDTNTELEEDFTMHCREFPSVKKHISSYYGRPILQKYDFSNEKTIMSIDYEDELDLFAILFIYPNDPSCCGYVKLYDNFTRKELKIINLHKVLCETNSYELHFDLNVIVLLENECTTFKVDIYQLC